jgi:sugar lactone lactonase YvrE
MLNARTRFLFLGFCCFFLLSACAAKKELPKVFYPPAPDAPRIQYLVSYSTEKDLKQGAFSRRLAEQIGDLGFGIHRARSSAFWDNKLYVVDSRLRGIARFDLLAEKGGLLVEASSLLIKPMDIAVDRKGTKFVTDPDGSKIAAIYADEKVIKLYREPAGFRPLGIAVDDQYIYAAELKTNRLYIIDKQSGVVVKTLGEDAGLRWPSSVALGPDGSIYVANLAAFNVIQLDGEAKKLNEIGKIGDYAGSFSRPKGLAVDREGRVYVLDAAFENVQVFNRKGKLLMFFASTGPQPQDLVSPASISIDYNNVDYFQQFAAPGFKLEYVIAVSNQAGPSRVNIYGFGKLQGADYRRYE